MTDAGNEELLAGIRDRRTAVGQALRMAPVAVDIGAGRFVCDFETRAEHCNPLGMVHGGFISAMVDEAMAIAALSKRRFEIRVPTLEMKVNFLAPVRPGRVRAEAWVVRLGRTIGFSEARLTDGDGTLLATATQTVRVVDFAKIQSAPRSTTTGT